MEAEIIREKSLAMFFDQDFDPINYVNVLFQSLTNSGPQHPNQMYSTRNLNEITNKSSNLITRFDYYTNELSKELNEKIEILNKSNNFMLSIEDNGKIKENDYNTSRLQYYINVLNNSIISLQTEVLEISNNTNQNSKNNARSLEKLTQFKLVKENLMKVLKALEIVKNILKDQDIGLIKVSDFQNALDLLDDTISKQIDNTNNDTGKVSEHIEELIALLPMFKGFTNFFPIYNNFTNKLTSYKSAIQTKK